MYRNSDIISWLDHTTATIGECTKFPRPLVFNLLVFEELQIGGPRVFLELNDSKFRKNEF
ncbi:hypothetical protein HZS_4524 [Henneguya salminicola]|nr:hypothetical protein HZS_4524 [Henneguya salminicola]